jgi:hypothetical protein
MITRQWQKNNNSNTTFSIYGRVNNIFCKYFRPNAKLLQKLFDPEEQETDFAKKVFVPKVVVSFL